MEKLVTYCGKQVLVGCDGKCNKAWGINNRPSEQMSDDPDDFAYYPDDLLGDAPVDPGTYEGDDAKPTDISEFPNKWCVRECERLSQSPEQEILELKSFSSWVFNISEAE